MRTNTLIEEIEAHLRATLSPKRVEHVYRVAQTARRLAERHGADSERAWLAALLHDLAREVPPQQLLSDAQRRGLPLTPLDHVNPMPRLHGVIAAEIAVERFGVADPEVLAAIASHTLGRARMSAVEQVVFLADYSEPGREDHPGLSEVRQLAEADLLLATRTAMDYTIRYLLETNRSIHPQVIDARNWILTGAGA